MRIGDKGVADNKEKKMTKKELKKVILARWDEDILFPGGTPAGVTEEEIDVAILELMDERAAREARKAARKAKRRVDVKDQVR